MRYLSEVKGRSGCVARVVAYSKAENSGTSLITFEYEAYRGILSELNTHCMLCKNAESSRAVPIKKRIEQIRTNPYVPIHWGSNQAGMVAGEEIDNEVTFNSVWQGQDVGIFKKETAWQYTAEKVADLMEAWEEAGYHKQIVNRIGEAFTTVKGVITATEWDNFWHLRRDPNADPAIKELADCMWKAKCEVEEKGLINILSVGEWHLPYVDVSIPWEDMGKIEAAIREKILSTNGQVKLNRQEVLLKAKGLTIEQALKISAVACGQVSFRKLDTSEETVERVWNRLMGGDIIHASVTQHQGTPIQEYAQSDKYLWPEGASHMDRDGNLWSAQFKHWIMFRKTIPNEVCNKYVENKI